MQCYIALLGGINVGGHRVKMAHLRALFEALGFEHVETLIASGNVIFETARTDVSALETQIEQHLHEALGYKVPTFIRSSEELTAIAAYQPFPDAGAYHTLSIMFMADTLPDDAQQTFQAFHTPNDEFHIHHREIYWLCRTKTSDSLVDWKRLGKTIPLPPMTVRNATTVRKLAEKYGLKSREGSPG